MRAPFGNAVVSCKHKTLEIICSAVITDSRFYLSVFINMSEKEEKEAPPVGEGEAGTDAKEEASEEESKDSDERQQDFGPDYSYDPGGTLIYTNPESKQQFVLNEAKTDWVPKDGSRGGATEKDKYDGEMPRICCVPECRTGYKGEQPVQGVSLHSFPNDEARFQQWPWLPLT